MARSEENRLINTVIWERPDGKNLVGRPHKRWKSAVTDALEKMGTSSYWLKLANIGKALCTRPGLTRSCRATKE